MHMQLFPRAVCIQTVWFSDYIQEMSFLCFICLYSPFCPFQLHEEDDALNMWMYDAVENNGKYTR